MITVVESSWEILYINPDGSTTLSAMKAHLESENIWWNSRTGLCYDQSPFDLGVEW